mmetsp:Transcript_14451/g.29550  ORF Transcript_14451/g.29550 Transcript_14451/m.29550 type:complete len:99 (-) Transcript_14451:826-1122(-)
MYMSWTHDGQIVNVQRRKVRIFLQIQDIGTTGRPSSVFDRMVSPSSEEIGYRRELCEPHMLAKYSQALNNLARDNPSQVSVRSKGMLATSKGPLCTFG